MAYVIGSARIDDKLFGDGSGSRATVRAATTAAGTLASDFEDGDAIDGVTLATNDRILIKNQGTGSENGIYIVQATGAPSRSDDFEAGQNAAGVYVWVNQGTANAGNAFVCTNAIGSDVIATDALTFSRYDVVGTLDVSRGGTGGTTFASGEFLQGNGASAISASGKSVPTGDVVGTTDTQTLTNKTVTSPIIDQINDANGNELLIFGTTASAVNELTVTNAATGTAPILSSTGGDANIDLSMQAKGTGTYNLLGTSDASAEIRVFEDTDDGSNYVGLKAGTIATSFTLTLPIEDGSSGDVLQTDGAGVLSFATPSASVTKRTYNFGIPVSAHSISYTAVYSFAWKQSQYSAFTGGALIYHVEIATRTLSIRVRNVTLGADLVEETGVGTTGVRVVTGFTNPTADALIEIQVLRSADTGASPLVSGIQLEWDT